MQLPRTVKGFGCGTACLPVLRLLSRGAARPRGRKRELLPRVLQALRRDPIWSTVTGGASDGMHKAVQARTGNHGADLFHSGATWSRGLHTRQDCT